MNCKWCTAVNRDAARFCATCRAPTVDGVQIENLRSGQKLNGRYEIRRALGKGAMGAVYGALDGNIANKRVAIKEYSPTRITNPADRQLAFQMFDEESKMLVRLDHPNMPKISDYFPEGASQYMVMDFIDGMTLEEYLIQYQRVPEPQVIQWGQQIAGALQFLHSQNPPIIFRDMKPGNVMLDKQGRIKLIDFGIARKFTPGKSKDTQQFGTPGYAPPEAYGKSQTDVRSDIYSLAVTLYALVSGFDPSNDPFNLPPLRSIVPTVSFPLERAIETGRQLKIDQRWQSMDQMNQALGAMSPAPVFIPTPPQLAYPNLGPHVVIAPGGAGTGGRTRTLTSRLAVAAAGLSNAQLIGILGAIAIVVLALVWFLAVPITRTDLEFDLKYPMLATVGVFAYVASRKAWAPLLAFTPLAIAASLATQAALAGKAYEFVSPALMVTGAVAAGLFMTGWAYLQPKFVGTEKPESYSPTQYIRDLIWALLMGLIATLVFSAASHFQPIWGYWSIYMFGALNGLVGWFIGDFVYRLTLEKKSPSGGTS